MAFPIACDYDVHILEYALRLRKIRRVLHDNIINPSNWVSIYCKLPSIEYLFDITAYYNDTVVGGVCCRVDNSCPEQKRLYIMTLGCLAPYRRLGIGTLMLQHVLRYVQKDGSFHAVFL